VLNVDYDVHLTLEKLDDELDAITEQYSTGGDFDGLCVDIVEASVKLWFAISWWSALYSVMEEPIPDALADNRLWQRYVGDTWSDVFLVLQALPVVDLMCEPDEFDDVVQGLLPVLQASLRRIGSSLALRPPPAGRAVIW
jgi:hypothetical protein